MPLYIFQCNKCKKSVELLIRMGETNYPYPCDCGGTCRKQIAISSFVVKGGTPKFCGKPDGLNELDSNIDELEMRKAQKKDEREQEKLSKLSKKHFV